MIATITFDADGTLCDFQRVMRRALASTLAELQRRVPGDAALALTIADLIADRDRVAEALRGRHATLEQVRHAAFERTLARLGVADGALAAKLSAHYFERRFGEVALYPDVLPALDQLRDRYRLGLVSNGNSYPERSGLAGRFAFAVFAHDHGIEKPDPQLFAIALRQAGCPPNELLHVGDSLTNDVGWAKAAGAWAVWLNRDARANDTAMRPDFAITSLADLPAICDELARAALD